MQNLIIRAIAPGDNAALAVIIRKALEEFGAAKPGTVYYDDSTDHLFELFNATPCAEYFTAEYNGTIVGGAGIFPTEGLPANTCELVKMYLTPSARGTGLGRTLIAHCLETAAAAGFEQVYLETMPELKQAVRVYEKFGFNYLTAPIGNTGHDGCGIWMLKQIA
ncbi:GNAT family N-acetyltransferase [Sediminibacterium ginsengisoli]|uniref:Putative acetyltransferase n=1 Tax=Sediminibacterium ginsengisoli TaxID=413434 RepID=A0A1T4PQR5_9BACT|nr:GNAT family N-acetyltransferase [Sediminibacterium ginsengisoli]SJZ93885.1 putative acetyltransferase [Sediminibacterium ginsengisoli]